jgi:hypothetical protein
VPHSQTSVLDHDDHTMAEIRADFVKTARQALSHPLVPRISQSKKDHGRRPASGKRRQLTKVQIEGQQDTIFRRGFGQDLAIGKPF